MPLLNPPAHLLGTANAVLSGRATRYEHRFTGPLSLKTVIRGCATWETGDGRFEVVPGAALVLDDGEEYEITVDALQPVETFCLFFARGFVEDAWRATTTASADLLDDDALPAIAFSEKLQFDTPLVAAIDRARRGGSSEGAFFAVALELVRARGDVASRVARVPSLRASTRAELGRRVGVATAFLHANLDRNVTVAETAREACLSPFHFHRLFTAFHGITPHRYLTRLRLERARALLRSSDRRVVDIATECGFDSLGSFATLFKRTFGITPGSIRKNGEVARVASR